MLSKVPFECPAHLLDLASKAATVPTAIVGAGARVALESARQASEKGFIEPLLVGSPAEIQAAAEEISWDISGFEIISSQGEAETAARGVSLARSGQAKALMKGQIHTDQLMKAVVSKEGGLRTGKRLSHLFYMTMPGREGAVSITDAAVNVAPNAEQRLQILKNAVELHHTLGQTRPKAAVLSATETPIASMPSSEEAAEIAARAMAGAIENADVEGPMALDLAVSPQAVKIKGATGAVVGQADILLVPNIETGNALFKGMVYYMSANAAGIVLGAKVPIVLTSRADPPEARLAAMALASISAARD